MSDILANTQKDSFLRRLQRFQLKIERAIRQTGMVFRRVDKRLVVFEAFHGSSYTCSPKAIYEAMLADERFRNYHFIWAFKDCTHHAQLTNNPRTTLVDFRSPAYYKAFDKAKYWIVNTALPLSLAKHPSKQVLVQCFHGTPLKRLRNDIVSDTEAAVDAPADHRFRNDLDTSRYDYLISPSRFATEKFTSAFDLERLGKQNIIIETGYPRNDFLINHQTEDVERVKTRLGIPHDKKVLLYAPTWRDDQRDPVTGYMFDPRLDFAALQADLSDEYVLLFRLHYNVADTFDFTGYEGFIYNVSAVNDINELYIISDVLMTDYSSVFFDFANLQRPILFYMYDQAHYQQQLRGFYLDVAELPGDVVGLQADVTDRLLRLSVYAERWRPKLAEFHATYNYLDDGQATQRVIDKVTSV